MRIVGLRVERHVDRITEKVGKEILYKEAELEHHIICGILEDNRHVEIHLNRRWGECPSGWTTAVWGIMKIKVVNSFNGFTHIPKETIIVDDIDPNIKWPHYVRHQIKRTSNTPKYLGEASSDSDIDDEIALISNSVFMVSYDGCDKWYPAGNYSVKMDLFEATPRFKKIRPVWLLSGPSGTGKSFLTGKMHNITVYETDCSDTLPVTISEQVIVLGNKYQYTVDEVKSRIFGYPNVEIHEVQFT